MGLASTAVDVGITASNIASAPATAVDWAFNPLVDWVATPLFALAEPVIGNDDVLDSAAQSWALVAQGMDEARTECDANSGYLLSTWTGTAAASARTRLDRQSQIYAQAAEAARGVASILSEGAQFVATVKDMLKAIITEFLEWAAFTMIAALANSFWTLGASDAAGVALVEGEAAITTGRVLQVINKIREVLTRMSRALHELIERYRALRAAAKALSKLNKINKELKAISKDGNRSLAIRALAWKGAKLTSVRSRLGRTLGMGTSGFSATKQAAGQALQTAEQDAAKALAAKIDELSGL